MWLVLLRKYWMHLLVLALVVWLGFKIYDAGSVHGASVVQEAWNTERSEYDKAIEDAKAKVKTLEENHRAEVSRINRGLSDAKREYEVGLARIDSDYRNRLRKSEGRAAVYQRQAEAGGDQCRSLGSHAARLDASLEEGRALVRELGQNLGLCQQRVKLLGDQILADRNLLQEGK